MDPDQANILWLSFDYYNLVQEKFKIDNLKQYINQFPFEGNLVMKNNLAETAKKHLLNPWDSFPESYVMD